MALAARHRLYRIHVWLGWLIGVPLLIWTATGLWMVARPIEEVRGVQLKAEPPTLVLDAKPVLPTLPSDHGPPLSLRLEQQWDGLVWIASFAHGHEMRASADNGKWLPPIKEEDAREFARRWYKPKADIISARHSPADKSPLDLRKERAAWGVTFSDGAHVYIDADTGDLLAIRSQQWQVFDFMWGLHIMDLETREETSHPVLIIFAALATISIFLALILLPISRRRKRTR
jgi:hypothetical protein